MGDGITLGVSTCIFPGRGISATDLALLERNGVESLEIGYERAGPALSNDDVRRNLSYLVQNSPVPVLSLHAPYAPDRDISHLDGGRRSEAVGNTGKSLELAHELGVATVVLHGSQNPIEQGSRSERLGAARQSLECLAERAQKLGLRLAVEMMPPEWLPAGPEEAFRIVDGLDPDVVGFCLDTNHANLTGDLGEIVAALGGRLWTVHLSDNDGLKQQHWMPFEGVIDWQPFMIALRKIRYSGPLNYELDPHPDGVERGLAKVRETFERLPPTST